MQASFLRSVGWRTLTPLKFQFRKRSEGESSYVNDHIFISRRPQALIRTLIKRGPTGRTSGPTETGSNAGHCAQLLRRENLAVQIAVRRGAHLTHVWPPEPGQQSDKHHEDASQNSFVLEVIHAS